MSHMTLKRANEMTPDARARMLMRIDSYLREYISDEELFMIWLEEGVPDGTETPEELADISAEDFVEMCHLAERIIQADEEAERE